MRKIGGGDRLEMGMRRQYREELQVCERRCNKRFRPIKPREDLKAGIRTSGADGQHERNSPRKEEEVEVVGSGLRLFVVYKVVVREPN